MECGKKGQDLPLKCDISKYLSGSICSNTSISSSGVTVINKNMTEHMINRKIWNFISEWNSTNNYTRKFDQYLQEIYSRDTLFLSWKFPLQGLAFLSCNMHALPLLLFNLRRNSSLQKIIRSFYPGNWASSMKSSVPM